MEKTRLITGEIKLEEQCESAQKNILKFAAYHDALLLVNGSIKNDTALTIQNIDVTQATTVQLRAEKK